MQYTVNRTEKGKVEVKVEVTRAEFDSAYDQTINKYKAEVKIAGFRPGKAPDDVVEGHVGLAKILNESASALISKHLSDIFKKEDFVPIDSPNVAVESLSKGSSFSFTSTFTLKPKVALGDWKKIKIKKVKAKEITEADVNESIKNIFEAWRKQKTTTDKGPLTTDKQEESDTSTSLSASQKPGTKYIYDAHGEKIFLKDEGGPPSHKASEGDSSEGINDNFAKAIGARDLAHLREIVKKDLETIVADQVEAKLERELFEEIAKICQVEVPDILVDDELNRILIRLNSQLEQQKKSLDDYLAEQKTTIDELKAKWRPQAEKNVKVSLIMDEVGKAEKVTVAREEVEAALKNVKQDGLSEEQKRDLTNYLALSIFQAKTLDLVKKIISP